MCSSDLDLMQRRRWGPSTMANTLDLLGTGSVTSEKNSSISKHFVLYQILSMAASILGPATICLMTAGTCSRGGWVTALESNCPVDPYWGLVSPDSNVLGSFLMEGRGFALNVMFVVVFVL